MNLYPLRFEPIYKAKVWGGRSLEELGRSLPAGEAIGESWELVDLAATSASGGGGGAERSVVDNGPLAGIDLHRLIEDHGKRLMGRLPLSDTGGFPLLVKFLDARENLSVQVHPSPAYAKQHPEAHLKSEAWYILDAEPGAVIYKGVREGTTAEQFREAIESNTVESLIIAVPVEPGDIHYLPSGTCHALGAGIVVAEVQTPSDTTFRVYDWGRKGRELHVEQALRCIHFGPAETERFEPHARIERERTTVERLVQCEYFTIDRVSMAAGYAASLNDADPVVWMVLDGRVEVTCEHDEASAQRTALPRGRTALLPAEMEAARVEAVEATTLLEVKFPQAWGDVIA